MLEEMTGLNAGGRISDEKESAPAARMFSKWRKDWPLPYRSKGPQARENMGFDELAEGAERKPSRRANVERDEKEKGSSDSISFYFSSISKHRLLTAGEEKELAARIANGDSEARKEMIEANLRLVVNIARRYINRGFPLQDLIEEGNVGLIKAVERFKTSKECRFSTYASYWIKQTIERALANKAHVVRLPIHISIDIMKVSRASRELMMELGREPNSSEVAERTGLSGRYVKKLDTVSRKNYSLEAQLPDGSDQSLLDKLEDNTFRAPIELISESQRAKKIKKWLSMLSETERAVLKLRFGFDNNEPETLEAIGKEFGVTRERIRQIEIKGMEKLRKIIKGAEIDSYEAI
ncbi:MAG: sigma-70 family RNA polymerase sigma factor [Deltaproteobacteria bacterium]|nr:sigma-70 family RNA polymerase sigma factor [Deltaproteobacteria bacterium]